MLGRLVFRVDAALLVAALGLAAAITLPVALGLGTAALAQGHGMEPGWIAYAADGGPIQLPAGSQPTRVVAQATVDGRTWSTYAVGDPLVAAGHARFGPEAQPAATLGGTKLARETGSMPLLGADDVLVHPSMLPAAKPVLALFPHRIEAPGLVVAPQAGYDAFKAAAGADLRSLVGLLLAGSLPAVAAVAGLFARAERRSRLHASAVLASLGSLDVARRVLVGRVTLLVLLAGAASALAGAALWRFGGQAFHPSALPWATLAFAFGVPAFVAWATGLLGLVGLARGIDRRLRHGPQQEGAGAGIRADVAWQPLVLGTRIVPILLVAGLLLAIDVGVPTSAASVPAAVAGGPGEWVVGGEHGTTGAGPPAALGEAAALFPQTVAAAVAESVAPTLLAGRAIVVRGGSWDRLASYHGLTLTEGSPALDNGTVVLGSHLAARTGWRVGQVLAAQSGGQAYLQVLRVVGVAQAGGILADEAFVPEATGRHLARLPVGQASLVRARPQTPEVLEVLQRAGPDLQVGALRLEPAVPAAGQLAAAVVDVVNLGPAPGARDLVVRIDGQALGSSRVSVGAFGRTTARLPFIAPDGAFRVDVNPELEGQASGRSAVLTAQDAWAGQPFTVHLADATGDARPIPGVAVGLFATLADVPRGIPLQQAMTDGDGNASLQAATAGELVVATLGDPAVTSTVLVGSTPAATDLRVGESWLEPARPTPGQPVTVTAVLRNLGGLAAEHDLVVMVGNRTADVLHVVVPPRSRQSVATTVLAGQASGGIAIDGHVLLLGTELVPGPLALGVPQLARSGSAAQAAIADQVLGDTRLVVVALGSVALATVLALLWLGTRHSIAQRPHVPAILAALGLSPAQVQARAAVEAGTMACGAMLVALFLAKVAFLVLALPGGPIAFGHGLPDPLDWTFTFQLLTAFVAVVALAAYVVTEPLARRGPAA